MITKRLPANQPQGPEFTDFYRVLSGASTSMRRCQKAPDESGGRPAADDQNAVSFIPAGSAELWATGTNCRAGKIAVFRKN